MRTIPPLLALPSELILAITNRLPLGSILTLRGTCLSLAKLCDFPLKDRRKRLYLHPKSIVYAINLLNSDTPWKDGISEVIVLGHCEPEMQTRSEDHILERKLDMKVWNQFPDERETNMTYADLGQVEGRSFDENYHELLEGLRRLEKVRVLKYADSMKEQGTGFCGVSDKTICEHARRRERYLSSFGGHGQPLLRHALRTTWWGDADVFASILNVIGGKVEKIEILGRMSAVDGFWASNKTIERPKGEAIQHVHITAPGQKGWTEYLDGLLTTMRNVRILEISIHSLLESAHMARRLNLPSAGQTILWEEEEHSSRYEDDPFDFSDLVASSSSTSIDTLQNLIIRASKSPYPHCLRDTTITSFLTRHATSLRHVEMHNILPVETSDEGLEGAGIYPEHDPKGGITWVAEHLAQETEVEGVVMRVPRLGCVEGCDGDGDGEVHRRGCGVYPVRNGFERVESLERFAQDKGVESVGEWWDFGKMAMRIGGEG